MIGRRMFQVVTTVAPFLVPVFLVLQQQLNDRALDWYTLTSAGVAALVALIVAGTHVQRAATEKAESDAEVVTKRDQDSDQRVEIPAPPANP